MEMLIIFSPAMSIIVCTAIYAIYRSHFQRVNVKKLVIGGVYKCRQVKDPFSSINNERFRVIDIKNDHVLYERFIIGGATFKAESDKATNFVWWLEDFTTIDE